MYSIISSSIISAVLCWWVTGAKQCLTWSNGTNIYWTHSIGWQSRQTWQSLGNKWRLTHQEDIHFRWPSDFVAAVAGMLYWVSAPLQTAWFSWYTLNTGKILNSRITPYSSIEIHSTHLWQVLMPRRTGKHFKLHEDTRGHLGKSSS